MRAIYGAGYVLALVYWVGPTVLPAEGLVSVAGGAACNATSTSNEKCKPDNSACKLKYVACHVTPEFTLDLHCIDDQLDTPCDPPGSTVNCGTHKNADTEEECN